MVDHRTCVSVRALLDEEVGSGVERRMATPEPSKMKRQGLVPQGTWHRMGACPTFVMVQSMYAGVPSL
jgi:hypothetical protein